MDGRTDIQTGHMDVTETLAVWIEFNMIIKRSEDSPIVFFVVKFFLAEAIPTVSHPSIRLLYWVFSLLFLRWFLLVLMA